MKRKASLASLVLVLVLTALVVVSNQTIDADEALDLLWPVQSPQIIQPFIDGSHWGIDIKNSQQSEGALVYAAEEGTVIKASWDQYGGGKLVKVDHGFIGGVHYFTWYAHLSEYRVAENEAANEWVAKGQVIGVMGCTGEKCDGTHLHFQLMKNTPNMPLDGSCTDCIDPTPYLSGEPGAVGEIQQEGRLIIHDLNPGVGDHPSFSATLKNSGSQTVTLKEVFLRLKQGDLVRQVPFLSQTADPVSIPSGGSQPFTAATEFSLGSPGRWRVDKIEMLNSNNEWLPGIPQVTWIMAEYPNLSYNAAVDTSSVRTGSGNYGYKLVDENHQTRWESEWQDGQWVQIDLGQDTPVDTIMLRWETAYAKEYRVSLKANVGVWHEIFYTNNGFGGTTYLTFPVRYPRYIKIELLQRPYDDWGYSLWEVEAYNLTPLPPTPCVRLFADAGYDYAGVSEYFNTNDPDLSNNIIGDNTTSSIWVEGDWWAILFEHPSFEGRYEIFAGSDSTLTDNYIGNDSTSSIMVGQGDPPADGVWLYRGPDYTETAERFDANDPDISNNTVGEDTVTSIRIQGDYWAILFRDRSFEGDYEIFDRGDVSLHDNTGIGNDSTSSIMVGQGDPPADGVWLYRGPDYTETAERFDANDPDISNNTVGEDTVTSIRIQGSYWAILFRDRNFAGDYEIFDQGDVHLYDNPGIGNDSTSSIMVGQGESPTDGVWLYQGPDYTETAEHFDGNDPDLSNNAIDEDTVTSIRIQGDYWAILFRDRNFTGNYEIFGEGDVHLYDNPNIGNDSTSSIMVGQGEPPPWALFGDFNWDCVVNVADIMEVASRWLTSCDNPDPDNDPDTPNYEARYDLNHDCDIDIVDIMLVAAHWGETC